jgi:hypothetical protein
MSSFKAKKPSTVTDVALRLIFADLLDRKQVRPGDLGRMLGFKNSNEIAKVLKGTRNYSRIKLPGTIELLVKKYNANRTFLETGHGNMYAEGKPFMANENENQFNLSELNITSYYSRGKIKEFEETIRKQQERIDHLEQLIKAKEETIELQRELLAKKKK